uniref:5'-deoxynucleotidase HDDC2 n=1 Tax=Syphacia muris TaxID=451379 RepID=A0A0N5AS02_9BILA
MNADIKIFELLKIIDNLKHLRRTGWVRIGVPDPETVASHMYRMAILAMSVKISDIDQLRCIRMALIHDLGESIAGDITPYCGITNEKKFQLEEDAFHKIAELVPKEIGTDWIDLWKEYEAGVSKEALFVKQLDKFDMVAQALEYELKYGIDCDQFFKGTQRIFTTEPFLSWDRELRLKHEAWKNERK